MTKEMNELQDDLEAKWNKEYEDYIASMEDDSEEDFEDED